MLPGFTYTIRKSARARRMSVTVYGDGRTVVTVPARAGGVVRGVSLLPLPRFLGGSGTVPLETRIEHFIRSKESWIKSKLRHFSGKTVLRAGKYAADKERARKFVEERLHYWRAHYQSVHGITFSWNKVSIKRTRSRWGSCSRRGNLNFNYKILYLPPHLADYIVVHELCHLVELNHGRKFWELAEKGCPGWRVYRRELKGVVG